MIVNLKKIQAMLVSKKKKTIPEDLTIYINELDIKPRNSVKLLGSNLGNKLNSENNISSICKSAICQLIESFIHSSFNYCSLV